mmetsp:Transcript_35556/g.62785  ORF Transcript_35556/g.62785 Transcript_35556/m.62785 type:complete len:231 (-) Transcript_35556:450-1142(-)
MAKLFSFLGQPMDQLCVKIVATKLRVTRGSLHLHIPGLPHFENRNIKSACTEVEDYNQTCCTREPVCKASSNRFRKQLHLCHASKYCCCPCGISLTLVKICWHCDYRSRHILPCRAFRVTNERLQYLRTYLFWCNGLLQHRTVKQGITVVIRGDRKAYVVDIRLHLLHRAANEALGRIECVGHVACRLFDCFFAYKHATAWQECHSGGRCQATVFVGNNLRLAISQNSNG